MYKIGIIGRPEDVLCYKATGFEISAANDPGSARDGLKKLTEGGCGVIFITEDLAKELSDEIDAFLFSPVPSIVPIPSALGNTGYGISVLKRCSERAIGTDILK